MITKKGDRGQAGEKKRGREGRERRSLMYAEVCGIKSEEPEPAGGPELV